MGRSNFAPTRRTLIVALVLILVGLLGTYGKLIPDEVGVLAFVMATILLLLGMVFPHI